MEGKKYKYLNGFNTLSNQQFTYLKEHLKENNDKNSEILPSSRLISNNNNILSDIENNRTITMTTDSTIDNSQKHYVYRKNFVKQKKRYAYIEI